MDIRAIGHQVTPDIWATVRMTGETFEMEDQRNWTDASYKDLLHAPRPALSGRNQGGDARHAAGHSLTLQVQVGREGQRSALSRQR